MINVALVDDHILLRNSLARIINNFDNFKVVLEADNGRHFIDQLAKIKAPDIVLLDISMPIMNGYETAEWMHKNIPQTKILVLSMMDDENSVIRMLNYGASGYILKDSKPSVLKEAFTSIVEKGFYSNDLVSGSMMHYVTNGNKQENAIEFSELETAFIKHACTEMTYKEIADAMQIPPRKVDFYRDAVFAKLQLKNRVGLVLYAVKEGIVKI